MLLCAKALIRNLNVIAGHHTGAFSYASVPNNGPVQSTTSDKAGHCHFLDR